VVITNMFISCLCISCQTKNIKRYKSILNQFIRNPNLTYNRFTPRISTDLFLHKKGHLSKMSNFVISEYSIGTRGLLLLFISITFILIKLCIPLEKWSH
jgi:hypothetical protein